MTYLLEKTLVLENNYPTSSKNIPFFVKGRPRPIHLADEWIVNNYLRRIICRTHKTYCHYRMLISHCIHMRTIRGIPGRRSTMVTVYPNDHWVVIGNG